MYDGLKGRHAKAVGPYLPAADNADVILAGNEFSGTVSAPVSLVV
jgi:hypothetical protein